MRWGVALCLAGCSYRPSPGGLDRGGDAAPLDQAVIPDTGTDAPPAQEFHLYVEAKIDGRSNLIVHGTSVTWNHFQFAAPGRETFTNVPTTLDAVQWQPVWPDIPDAENRDCGCLSSSYTSLPAPLPAAPSTVTITHVKGRRTTTPSVLQPPDAGNDYTLIVEFTDVGLSGSDIYGGMIDVVTN